MQTSKATRILTATLWVAVRASSQPGSMPPFIDMHVHSTNTTPAVVLEAMKTKNLRFAFLAALAPDLEKWNTAITADYLMTGLVFPCPAAARFSPAGCAPTNRKISPAWLGCAARFSLDESGRWGR